MKNLLQHERFIVFTPNGINYICKNYFKRNEKFY